ncbi:hypothetical protein F750_4995 [Streptomyces sp. PAMC 26508]|nr:hypothetical protein F750_4995 [Streptomyces sp. PAMC 26508]
MATGRRPYGPAVNVREAPPTSHVAGPAVAVAEKRQAAEKRGVVLP